MKMIHKVVNFMILLTFFVENSKQVSVIVKSTHFIGSMKIVDGKQVNVFLGIPYAQPPIGSLRFKKPLPVEPKKTVDATEWRSACYQNDLFKEILINKKVSEDCLYLNIWSPKNDSERNYEIDPLRPVMFWIHGGAFISDSSNRQLYDSEFLAAKGDIVVVSVNYRLDIFGFLYTGTDEAPGMPSIFSFKLYLNQ
jgi:carboxylesterase type B